MVFDESTFAFIFDNFKLLSYGRSASAVVLRKVTVYSEILFSKYFLITTPISPLVGLIRQNF